MIIRLLIAAVLLYLAYRIGRRFFLPPGKKVKPLPSEPGGKNGGEDLVEDPVCHTYLPVSNARKWEMGGRTVYFCSDACREQFEKQAKKEKENA